jgi:lantibiotic leader peptide-processing serine protease
MASSASARHVVQFVGDIPSDLAATINALGGKVDAEYAGVGAAVVSNLTDAAAAQLAARSDVEAVGRDREFQFLDPSAPTPIAEASDESIMSTEHPAAATRYARQWNLRAIKADVAWAAGKLGSPSVRVAILDTGIDYTLPDLAGLVDLSRSASFVPSDDEFLSTTTLPFLQGKHPVTDLHYHGTHVAATVSSNATLAAGVTSKTTLMGVKVLSRTGSGSTAGILGGIVYAVDNGADVINISLGVIGLLDGKDPDVKALIKTTNRAFQYAHKNGVTVVVSAGNESLDLDTKHSFQAYCSSTHVVCVSATGPTAQNTVNGPWENIDAFAPYSNFGRKDVNVAAPGGNASAVWAACSSTSVVMNCRTLADGRPAVFILGLRGTSMAAPHVSGLAAFLIAELGHGNPGLIESIIERSADDLGASGRDAQYGNGRINVANALGLN